MTQVLRHTRKFNLNELSSENNRKLPNLTNKNIYKNSLIDFIKIIQKKIQ